MALLAEKDGTNIATPHGIYRRKYHMRALFQSILFIALLGGYHVYNNIGGGRNQTSHVNRMRANKGGIKTSETTPATFLDLGAHQGDTTPVKRRLTMMDETSAVTSSLQWEGEGESLEGHERLLAADVSCDDIKNIEPAWYSVFFAIGVLYMFVAIAIVCDDFFVPALEEISSPHHMNLDKDVAGATLMAAGGSAPELFTNLFGTFTESNIGFGTIIGSATFNVLLVIAMCSIFAKEVLDLTWWPLFRDASYYAVGLVVLALFVGVNSPGEIEIWEAVVLFLMYIGYVTIMWKNRYLHKSLTGKELVVQDLNEETSAGDEESGNLELVKEQFDKLDDAKSGAVTEVQLRELLLNISSGEEDFNIEDALTDIRHGQEDEVTAWEDFADWYRGSVFFERTKKIGDDDDEPLWAPLLFPDDAGIFGIIWHLIKLPIVACLTFTVPNVERPGNDRWCYLAFILAIVWIGVFAYFMVAWTELIGNTIGVPHVVMGYTVLAAGTSVPDLISSVIVTRQGSGDMAISSSIGSNIFDITVGLPIPWLIYMAIPDNPKTIMIDSDNIWISICVFLAMLVLVVLAIHCQGWKLTKTLGFIMFVMYVIFIVQAIWLELPFKSCVAV